ncbi:MBL fold metallo-hydrolase [Tyzzerella sp. An114]|uniref:MBL fold metallo-hydrolase n=1 Tax=Tyzzerella sp. An114 TaxID=1965545 RepID=UPI000B440FBF|nr:MBL fold metallo-hydrolase [Tyzzerella sp. An114]OUQ56631.1 MBL fold metallo-hydrolase [Tyzzerella sp. An114]
MAVRFCPIASGSSGNCIYAGTESTNILFDAGLSGKRIKEGLDILNVDGTNIDALFITHEHSDHIKGAGIISRRFDIPIYATEGTWEAMENTIGNIGRRNKKFIYSGEPCVINDMCIMPFDIPHDAAEPVGYSIFAKDFKMTIATDLGHVTDTVKENIQGSDVLLLESNHDVDMLKCGSYPWALKQRILGDKGHISNETAGKLISEIMDGKLKHIYLGHLSDENNEPHLAYETVKSILNENDIKVGTYLKMDMASRYSNSCPVIL